MHDELQQLIRLLVLHRYDIYADRRKNRIVYTVSAILSIEERIQELQRQRATTATVAIAADNDTSNEQRKDVQP
jgi:hypothetical protein